MNTDLFRRYIDIIGEVENASTIKPVPAVSTAPTAVTSPTAVQQQQAAAAAKAGQQQPATVPAKPGQQPPVVAQVAGQQPAAATAQIPAKPVAGLTLPVVGQPAAQQQANTKPSSGAVTMANAPMEDSITPAFPKGHRLNKQQRSVKQMPAKFRPKSIRALGAPRDPQHPAKGYFVGGESLAEERDETGKKIERTPHGRYSLYFRRKDETKDQWNAGSAHDTRSEAKRAALKVLAKHPDYDYIIREQSDKPRLIKTHYFRVESYNQDLARQIGLDQDRAGHWILRQYDRSGAPFDRTYSNAVRAFGKPRTDTYEAQPPIKTRNPVAKHAPRSGAGAHVNRKKADRQGDVKHKKTPDTELLEMNQSMMAVQIIKPFIRDLISKGVTEVTPDAITSHVSARLKRDFLLKDLVNANKQSRDLQTYISSIDPTKVKFSADMFSVKNENPEKKQAKQQAQSQATVASMAQRAATRYGLAEAEDGDEKRYADLNRQLKQLRDSGKINTARGRGQAKHLIRQIQDLVTARLPGHAVPSYKMWLTERPVKESLAPGQYYEWTAVLRDPETGMLTTEKLAIDYDEVPVAREHFQRKFPKHEIVKVSTDWKPHGGSHYGGLPAAAPASDRFKTVPFGNYPDNPMTKGIKETMGEIEEDMVSRVRRDLTQYLDRLERKEKRRATDSFHAKTDECGLEEDPTTSDDLSTPPPAPQIDPTLPEAAIKTVALEDGCVLEIFGNMDTGFGVRRGDRALSERFSALEEAEMAIDLWRARRGTSHDQDYIEER